MNYTLIIQAVLLIFAIIGVITVFTAIMFYIQKLLSDREERKKMENRRNTLYVCETLYGDELMNYCKCLRTTKEYRRDLLKHGTPTWRLIQLEDVYNLSHSTMRNDKRLFESQLKEYKVKVSVRFFKYDKEVESYEIIEKITYKNAGDIIELKDELLLDDWLNKHYDNVECDLSDYNQVDELDTPSKLINEVITVYGYDFNDDVYIYGR